MSSSSSSSPCPAPASMARLILRHMLVFHGSSFEIYNRHGDGRNNKTSKVHTCTETSGQKGAMSLHRGETEGKHVFTPHKKKKRKRKNCLQNNAQPNWLSCTSQQLMLLTHSTEWNDKSGVPQDGYHLGPPFILGEEPATRPVWHKHYVCSFCAHFRSFERQLQSRVSSWGVRQNRSEVGNRGDL